MRTLFRPLAAIITALLSGCLSNPRPGAGGQCGVEDPHPSQGIDKPLTGCLIMSWDMPRPFCGSNL